LVFGEGLRVFRTIIGRTNDFLEDNLQVKAAVREIMRDLLNSE
jgi:hypothetical protein